jgi:hypothetical protein
LLYVAAGNPVPDFFGGVRMGKNLYTAAMIVLDCPKRQAAMVPAIRSPRPA